MQDIVICICNLYSDPFLMYAPIVSILDHCKGEGPIKMVCPMQLMDPPRFLRHLENYPAILWAVLPCILLTFEIERSKSIASAEDCLPS